MMNALLIDSQLEALTQLERLLRLDGRLDAIHCCTDPGSAWLQLRRTRPDVVFLDTHYSGPVRPFDGIALADRIRKLFPRIHLVFISSDAGQAYSACQAFPLAFTVKPLQASRLQAILDRLFLDAGTSSLRPDTGHYGLRCFGDFEIVSPYAPAAPIRLPTRLSRELLAFLVTNFDRTVTRAELMSSLMPEQIDGPAINLLHVNLYKLRRFLERNEHILCGLSIPERYRLAVPKGVCDVIDFARFIRKPLSLTPDGIAQGERIASLYRGPCFASEDYPWAESLRTELELAHEQLLLRIAEFRWDHDEPVLSEQALRTLIQTNPLSEEGHCTLLDQYLQRNERRKFLSEFEHYRKIMRDELDVAVDSHYQRVYQQLRTT